MTGKDQFYLSSTSGKHPMLMILKKFWQPVKLYHQARASNSRLQDVRFKLVGRPIKCYQRPSHTVFQGKMKTSSNKLRSFPLSERNEFHRWSPSSSVKYGPPSPQWIYILPPPLRTALKMNPYFASSPSSFSPEALRQIFEMPVTINEFLSQNTCVVVMITTGMRA